MAISISLTVNGAPISASIDPGTLLVQFLRDQLRLTGTHIGCDTAQCGACTVHLNGRAIKSCNILAVQAEGATSPPSKGSPKTAPSTRCKPPSNTVTACSAGSVRPAW